MRSWAYLAVVGFVLVVVFLTLPLNPAGGSPSIEPAVDDAAQPTDDCLEGHVNLGNASVSHGENLTLSVEWVEHDCERGERPQIRLWDPHREIVLDADRVGPDDVENGTATVTLATHDLRPGAYELLQKEATSSPLIDRSTLLVTSEEVSPDV